MLRTFAICTLAICSISLTSSARAFTLLNLQSEAGDYVGQGQALSLDPGDGSFSATRNFDNGVKVNFFGGAANFWLLEFAAPFDAELAVGAYENATRFPLQAPEESGLQAFGEGRGCNTLTGRFDVLEVEYAPNGDVIRFAADFEQHCEGATPALFGQVRVNSTIPEPTAAFLLGSGLAAVALRRHAPLRETPGYRPSP